MSEEKPPKRGLDKAVEDLSQVKDIPGKLKDLADALGLLDKPESEENNGQE